MNSSPVSPGRMLRLAVCRTRMDFQLFGSCRLCREDVHSKHDKLRKSSTGGTSRDSLECASHSTCKGLERHGTSMEVRNAGKSYCSV